MKIIAKYFTGLTDRQIDQFARLAPLYDDWNAKINVISRKDTGHIYERHVLHSLAIAKVIRFKPGTRILDVGTGGGFPGIPLAIFFPDTQFMLIDSIGKKIKVVHEIAAALELQNVQAEHVRAEDVKKQFDFVVSRAVTAFPKFVAMTRQTVSASNKNELPNGILYLKGGDFDAEIQPFGQNARVFALNVFFEEKFFETKKLIHLAIKNK
jgi:16S rRNA (guanine527-N7)-methyltransferase